jgi:glutathione synthase/RimK-type ligase-like ATP-grasp enzyme
MLLILTSDTDLTADFLIVALLDRKLPYFRLNAEDLTRAEYEFTDSGIRQITVGPRSVDLAEVKAVWYRRALFPITSAGDSHAQRVFTAGEVRHLAFGMVWNPEIIWVNPIDKVYVAEHKIHQLITARRIGFSVPRTIVSNDVGELKAFAESNPSGTICKPIYHGLFIDGPDAYSVYTRQVSANEFDGEKRLECPVLLQENVARQCDLRVTFIGKQIFSAAVHTSSSTVDWRDPTAGARFTAAEIDPDLESKCRQMLSMLGLRYGAFDFIQRPDGEVVFLEINPTGEWAWLENSLGYPMRNAFIDLFYGEQNA